MTLKYVLAAAVLAAGFLTGWQISENFSWKSFRVEPIKYMAACASGAGPTFQTMTPHDFIEIRDGKLFMHPDRYKRHYGLYSPGPGEVCTIYDSRYIGGQDAIESKGNAL